MTDGPPPTFIERALLSFLGTGLSPVAPGTVGSLAAAVLIHAAHALFGLGPLAAGLALAFGGLVTLAWAGRAVGAEGRGDPGWVVADEVAGQALASAAVLPAFGWSTTALAFLLFRVFDVTKPGIVRRVEQLPGGIGVLGDDLVAGAMAALLLLPAALLGWLAPLP